MWSPKDFLLACVAIAAIAGSGTGLLAQESGGAPVPQVLPSILTEVLGPPGDFPLTPQQFEEYLRTALAGRLAEDARSASILLDNTLSSTGNSLMWTGRLTMRSLTLPGDPVRPGAAVSRTRQLGPVPVVSDGKFAFARIDQIANEIAAAIASELPAGKDAIRVVHLGCIDERVGSTGYADPRLSHPLTQIFVPIRTALESHSGVRLTIYEMACDVPLYGKEALIDIHAYIVSTILAPPSPAVSAPPPFEGDREMLSLRPRVKIGDRVERLTWLSIPLDRIAATAPDIARLYTGVILHHLDIAAPLPEYTELSLSDILAFVRLAENQDRRAARDHVGQSADALELARAFRQAGLSQLAELYLHDEILVKRSVASGNESELRTEQGLYEFDQGDYRAAFSSLSMAQKLSRQTFTEYPELVESAYLLQQYAQANDLAAEALKAAFGRTASKQDLVMLFTLQARSLVRLAWRERENPDAPILARFEEAVRILAQAKQEAEGNQEMLAVVGEAARTISTLALGMSAAYDFKTTADNRKLLNLVRTAAGSMRATDELARAVLEMRSYVAEAAIDPPDQAALLNAESAYNKARLLRDLEDPGRIEYPVLDFEGAEILAMMGRFEEAKVRSSAAFEFMAGDAFTSQFEGAGSGGGWHVLNDLFAALAEARDGEPGRIVEDFKKKHAALRTAPYLRRKTIPTKGHWRFDPIRHYISCFSEPVQEVSRNIYAFIDEKLGVRASASSVDCKG